VAAVPTILVDYPALARFAREAATAMGVRAGQVETYVDVLLQGSLRSLPGQGQGVQQLPVYWDRIQRGVIDCAAEPEIVRRDGATATIDAHRALGSVAGVEAMSLALDLARAHGIGAVGVRDSTHFGIAAYYAMRALPYDCIGLTFSNAGPEIAPWGGTQATVGTNPWAAAVPAGRELPVVLDMANSTSGKGMIGWHHKEGRPIPSDWALAEDGSRTEDAAAGLAGTLFPLGGPKGYAMAVVVDALTGVLMNSAFGLSAFGIDHQNIGHLMIAIDVARFDTVAAFKQRMDDLIGALRGSPLAAGVERIYAPGELEYHRERERRADGVPIEVERFEGLEQLAGELGIAPPQATEAAA
jgi:LDH2 family malate/lactate/ureidoglycolate dehydrogenase